MIQCAAVLSHLTLVILVFYFWLLTTSTIISPNFPFLWSSFSGNIELNSYLVGSPQKPFSCLTPSELALTSLLIFVIRTQTQGIAPARQKLSQWAVSLAHGNTGLSALWVIQVCWRYRSGWVWLCFSVYGNWHQAVSSRVLISGAGLCSLHLFIWLFYSLF